MPAALEETAPAFIHHDAAELPVEAGEGKTIRIIAGSLYGTRSPLATLTHTIFADVALNAGASLPLDADAEERAIYVVSGEIDILGDRFAAGRLLVFRPDDRITLTAVTPARLAILGGAAMDGPRHIWWNFVSSRRDRIVAPLINPFPLEVASRHSAAGELRDGGKIKKRTIANLSNWPTELVEGLRTLLKGGKVAPADQETIIVRRALPHGHVAAVLGALRDIGLDRLLGPARNRCRDLVIAMIVARLIAPASKLATARMLDPLTAASSLGAVLGLGPVDEDELYVALDWLGERQQAIEKALARKHLREGALVLYDVSSSYLEGRCCELARLGYNRDGKKGKLQIVYGLLCAPDGCPVAIEVFEGDTADPPTLAGQIDKVKKRFAIEHVVLVGDRGMITQARIDAEIAPAGLDWITALRAPAIRALAEAGALQMSLFDERDMAAITSPDYPGERLVVCRNPDLARERARKRQDLLAATEKDLAAIAAAVRRSRSRRAGRPRLRSGSAPSSTGTRWPSTSSSSSARRASRSIARPRRSPPRRRWTASMSCAPACRRRRSTPPRPSAPTRASPASSARSVP